MSYKKYKDYHKYIDNILYKKCKICEEWLEANLDNFGKDKNQKDGFNSCCRICRTKEGHKNYILNIDKYKESIADKIAENKLYNSEFNDYTIEDYVTKIIINTNEEQRITIIDTEELEKVKLFGLRWCINNPKDPYAKATKWEIINGEPKLKSYYLHMLIMGLKEGSKVFVDHINHNKLDNRKENLRLVTKLQNNSYRKSKNSNNKSGYRNVFWNSQREKWQVSICKNYKHIIIGYFDDVDEAGRVAEEARQQYFGKFAGKS